MTIDELRETIESALNDPECYRLYIEHFPYFVPAEVDAIDEDDPGKWCLSVYDRPSDYSESVHCDELEKHLDTISLYKMIKIL